MVIGVKVSRIEVQKVLIDENKIPVDSAERFRKFKEHIVSEFMSHTFRNIFNGFSRRSSMKYESTSRSSSRSFR